MKKWLRVTPVANSAAPVAESTASKTHDDPRASGATGQTKLDRGRKTSILYGTSDSIPHGKNSVSEAETNKKEVNQLAAPADTDFKFWQSEILDPKTGRTADSKILYNIGG
jgi:hypothetical protein